MLLHPGLLVGVMAQLDWMSDGARDAGPRSEGRGWMAGPYLGARLTPNLYFDARVAWGRSDNEVDPLGAYVDRFDTTRLLASAKLTGDWSLDGFRLRPSAEVIWFKETQHAYENAIGIAIDSQSFHLGRAVFGPEIGYAWRLADETVIEPFVGVKGVWDFAGTEQSTAAGAPLGGGDVRARFEGGLAVRTPSGVLVRGTGAYDGFGSDGYRANQGQVQVVVPLR
jgi:outer membrane autotransporter protein